MTTLILTVPISIGGDTPTWEGEATFRVSYHPGSDAQTFGPPEACHQGWDAEIGDITCIGIGGRKPSPDEAEAMVSRVEDADWFMEALAEEYAEHLIAAQEYRDEARRDRIEGWEP